MSIKFERIKPGMILYDRHRYQTNGGGSRMGEWKVEVLSVDTKARTAVVVWNNNKPETMNERRLSRLSAKSAAELAARKARRG